MHALARLIEDVKASHAWSNGDVARRTGGLLARTRIQQLVTEPVKRLPSRETVEGLAAGLGVPAWVVVDAYLEALGLPARPNSVTVEEAIGADPQLSGDTKAMLRAMVAQARASGPAAAARGDKGTRSTSTAQPFGTGDDLDPAATEQERVSQDDAGFAAFMRGEGGWDRVTAARYRKREEQEAKAAGELAADRGPSEGRRLREELDRQAETPDPEGPDSGS